MKNIEQRLNGVREKIADAEQKFGRKSGSVKLLAVSKTRQAEEILGAVGLGQVDFGENYVQEAISKMDTLRKHELCWHFIGPIQSNKTANIAQHFDWVHSIDRLKIAKRLNEVRPTELPALNTCIQVNISGEESKSGIAVDEVEELANSISQLPRLKLRGLMTMPAQTDDFEEQRQAFRSLVQIYNKLNKNGFGLDTLSMGTTNDMEAAIAEGATIVRVGTAIFGPRKS